MNEYLHDKYTVIKNKLIWWMVKLWSVSLVKISKFIIMFNINFYKKILKIDWVSWITIIEVNSVIYNL